MIAITIYHLPPQLAPQGPAPPALEARLRRHADRRMTEHCTVLRMLSPYVGRRPAALSLDSRESPLAQSIEDSETALLASWVLGAT
eukprot:1044665-Prymnesium_polylepis.1